MGNMCRKNHEMKQYNVIVDTNHTKSTQHTITNPIKIMSPNVLSQRAYEKYIDKTMIPIDEQTRLDGFYKLLYETLPDIIAIQEGVISWFDKYTEYCYVGNHDKKSDNCCFLYNKTTIKLICSFANFS